MPIDGGSSRGSPAEGGAGRTGAPDPAAAIAPARQPSWRRFGLLRSFVWCALPAAAVALTNASLFTAVVLSPEEYSDIPRSLFWFVDARIEGNVSTWVNAGLWLAAGLLAACIGRRAATRRVSWWTFAVIGVVFSIEETLVHGQLDGGFRAPPPGAAQAWILPGLLLAGLAALLLLRLVLSLPAASRNGFLLGGAVFFAGSLGFDALGGLSADGYTGVFVVLATLEEALEMTGVALCIASMLHLIEHARLDGGTAYRVNTHRDAAHSRRPRTEAG
jgi:hypothetical protein